MSVSSRVTKFASSLNFALALTLVASVVVVALPQEWLQQSFELEPRRYPAQVFGDAFVGGDSEARWLDQSAQKWECQLKPGAQDPYCSLRVDLTNKDGVGIDLSRFDNMTIWADYQGSATHLRLYLRNRHPNYFIPENEISTKYNMIEVPVAALHKGLELPMSTFTVAGWWLIGGNIPLSDSHPEFNEVAIMELQTGSSVRSGTHEIQLNKVQWSGAWVTQNTLYKAVISAWSAIVFCIFSFRLVTAQHQLKQQRKIQQELEEINNSLRLESLRFEELAKTDSLTGLRNRVGIRDILYSGMVGWRDKKLPFSFVIIDLDKFKDINDTYGHDAGDAVLKDVARLMSDNVRQADALARWGGEEFVLVCPGTNLEQATQIAEKLRAALESQLKCQGKPVTASFGVATMSEVNMDQLFKKADKALYQAKQLGRNRVCIKLTEQDSTSIVNSLGDDRGSS